MTDSIDDVLAKLKKIKDHADSAASLGNAAEAASFAAKLNELLVKHELTMSDVEYAKLPEKDPIARGGWVGATASTRCLWQENLASVLARPFLCRFLVSRGTDAICFVGRASHRVAVEYLYVRLRNEIEELSRLEYKRLRSRLRRAGGDLSISHEFKESFRDGYIKTIRDRLRDENQTNRAGATGAALVRLTNALALVDEVMKEQGVRDARDLSGRDRTNALGRALGSEHGKRANLNVDGVGSGATRGQIR